MLPQKNISRVCCVVECKNTSCNSPGTQFYKFPTTGYKKSRREKWINAVKRNNPDGSPWQPKFYTRICSRHFIRNRKSDDPFSPSYIPTIFSSEHCKNKYCEKTVTERFKCGLKERMATIVKSKSQIGQADTTIERSLNNSNEAYSDQLLKNQEAQVDFLEEPSDCKLFICNRYVSNGICEADVQTCFPIENGRKIFKTNVDMEDKSCGTSRNAGCIDTVVGSDPIDLDEDSFIKCSIEYKETPSISNIDLQIKTEPEEMKCNLDLYDNIDIKEEPLLLEYQPNRDCKPELNEDLLIGTPCHSDINSSIKVEMEDTEFKVEDLPRFIKVKNEPSILECRLDLECKPEINEEPCEM